MEFHCKVWCLQPSLPLLRSHQQSFRYVAVILNLARNMHHAAVAADVTDAILKKHSVKGLGTEYWNKLEQKQKLEAVFAKWAKKGLVWSAAAMQVSAFCSTCCLEYAESTGIIRCIRSSSNMFKRVALNAATRTSCLMAAASKALTRAGTHSNESSQVGSLSSSLLATTLSSAETFVWPTVVLHKP